MSALAQTASASLNWPALQAAFADRLEFTRAEVLAFYHHTDPSLNPNTLDSRIRQLLQRRLLLAVGRGRYALATNAVTRPTFQPTLSRAERTFWRTLVKEVQLPEGCLWSTAWANEFSSHQAAHSLLLAEVPRDYVQAVFFILKDRYSHRVFLRPQPETLTYYIAEAARPIVVLPFVSRAPTQLVDRVPVPRLEKLLVDLFSRPDLFPAYQGHELKTIFTNARRHYRLDERTLLRYAQRRHHADDLRQFLRQLPDWPQPATTPRMIAPETFRPEWLADLRRRHRGLDPSIVEKMIFALALVERLAQDGLPFVFKGGTCLVLLLGQLRRFSVDVDIVTTASPDAVAQAVALVCQHPPFRRYEYDERRSTKDGIPRGHYYLYFNPIQDLNRAEPYVALDVLYESHGYPALLSVPVQSDFLQAAGEPQLVTIPSVESITGDKLTAFAPTTTGIRYDYGKEQEIIKQLFDLGILFDEVQQVDLVNAAYQATVSKELVYRNLTGSTPANVLADTIRTALHLAHLKLNRRLATPTETTASRELANGITAFASFPFATRFGTDQAAISAAKAAYLAARLLVANYSTLPRYPANPAPAITDQRLNYLNKLRSVPAAFYYWQHTVELLTKHAQVEILLPIE